MTPPVITTLIKLRFYGRASWCALWVLGLIFISTFVVAVLIMCVFSWWRHQMETVSALLVLCEGNPLVTGGFPSQRPVTERFNIFVDLYLKKRLIKQSARRWFETLPRQSLTSVLQLPLSYWMPRSCNTGPWYTETRMYIIGGYGIDPIRPG